MTKLHRRVATWTTAVVCCCLIMSGPELRAQSRQVPQSGSNGEGTTVQILDEIPDVTDALPLARVHMDGRHGLRTSGGRAVTWRGATAFQLVELVAHGRQDEAERFVEGMKPVQVFRVLLMAAHLFTLSPAEGIAALPATLDLAERHGTYLEITIFADTSSFPGLNYRDFTGRVAAICAAKPACAAIELGNELSPLHSTQDEVLGDVTLLRALRAIVKQQGNIPVSLGSTHADQDGSDRFREGDYLTIHGARSDGGWNDWGWVTRSSRQRTLADRLNRFAVNDEPRRDDLACDKQLGMGLLASLLRIGDTFHYRNGLFAMLPEGEEFAAFRCRVRGWTVMPVDWAGSFENAGAVNSPVKSFDRAVEIYSSIDDGQAYTLVLGAQPGLRIDWSDDWPHREQVLSEGSVQLWKATRNR